MPYSSGSLAPHDEVAERGVLGSMMLSDRATGIAFSLLSEEDFYLLQHQQIFSVMKELYLSSTRKQLDELVVRAALDERKLLNRVGGDDYLRRIVENTPHAANIEAYIEIVLRRSEQRALIKAGHKITQIGQEPKGKSLLETAFNQLMPVQNRSRPRLKAFSINDLFATEIGRMIDQRAGKGVGLVPTGIEPLDALLVGGLPRALVTLGARQNTGKTMLALNIARNICNRGKKVVYLSGETHFSLIARRMLSSLTNINTKDMLNNNLTEEDFQYICQRASETNGLAETFRLVWSPRLCLADISREARLATLRGDLDLIVVDYLTRLDVSAQKSYDRRLQLDEILSECSAIAGESNCTVLMLAQIGREGLKEEEPKVWHLKETGGLEEFSRCILLMHATNATEGVTNIDAERRRRVDVILGKSEEGVSGGRVTLCHHVDSCTFGLWTLF